jgi:ribosomal protein S3AE
MSTKYEYTVTVNRKGWFTVMASNLAEAKEIAYEMSDKELEKAARWEETELYAVD